MPRADRRIKPIAGIGGRLEIVRPHATATEDTWPEGILDVARWQVRHLVRSAEVTHSGSNGSIKRAIVARDFNFAVACPWNSREHAVNTPGLDVLYGFMEQILTGDGSVGYDVGIRFFLGDPLSYTTDAGLDLSSRRCLMYAPLTLAEEFTTICDSTGQEVVRNDFTGRGNSLLRLYRGVDPVFGAATALEAPPA